MKVPKARKLASGTWFIQLRLGGESIPVTARTEKECIRDALAIKSEYLAGRRVSTTSTLLHQTLTEAIDTYIEKRSNTLSPLTIRGYRIIQHNRFQEIMGRKVQDLASKGDWQAIVNQEAKEVSPKTLSNAYAFLRSVILAATGIRIPEVTLPTPIRAVRAYLTPEQIKVFVSAVSPTKYAVPALLALSSMRISEIQALRWQEIPAHPDFIPVRGAVVLDEHNQKIRKASNKNLGSTRNVPILIPELRTVLERDRKPKGPVLTISQNSLRVAIHRLCEERGLPSVTIHGLRHSFASLAYYLQIPERIAMEIGGWEDASTMHEIYTHIARSDIRRYENALADFYAHEAGGDPKDFW